MNLRLWPFFFEQALKNIMSNRVVHVIGLITMVVSMLIFGTFLLLFVNLGTWIQGWGHSMSMSVYIEDGVNEDARHRIRTSITELPTAEIKRFISKEAALKDLKKCLGSHAGLLDGLSDNPLPASFELVLEDKEGQKPDPQKIKEKLEKIEGVEEVQYSEEWLKRFKGVMDVVRLVGLVVGGFLCLGVLLIMTNTIKLAIYSRKDEIEILKLVGATDWFVKIPFLLEGIIQGALSGALALLVLFLGYLLFSSREVLFLDLGVLNFTFLPQEYAISIFLISTFLGLAGSFIAVGRFISVGRFFDV